MGKMTEEAMKAEFRKQYLSACLYGKSLAVNVGNTDADFSAMMSDEDGLRKSWFDLEEFRNNPKAHVNPNDCKTPNGECLIDDFLLK